MTARARSGIVGDEAVDAPIDEPGHVLRRVDGPRDDGKPELLRPAEALLGQVAEGGRPDLAAGTLDESRHGTAEAVDIEPGGPGGGAVDALLHGVEMALARQARAGELGRDGFERLEGAPVERLHDHAALHPGRAHRLGDGLGEGLGIRRVVAPGGELGLDVEADVVGAGAANEVEHLGEARDAGAVGRLLGGKAAPVGRTRLQPPDVVAGQLREGQRPDRRPDLAQELAVRTARGVRVEPRVVMDDEDAVAGHAEVELERRNADRECLREGGKRVLGREPARAAMALQVERSRLDGPLIGALCRRDKQHQRRERAREVHSAKPPNRQRTPASRRGRAFPRRAPGVQRRRRGNSVVGCRKSRPADGLAQAACGGFARRPDGFMW